MNRRIRDKSGPHGDAAMSFDEIGRELGITRGGAWMAYKSALRKLRRKETLLRKMRELSLSKERR